jgi:hypothetical protein
MGEGNFYPGNTDPDPNRSEAGNERKAERLARLDNLLAKAA